MDNRGHHLCANEAKTAGWASSVRHSTTNQEQRGHIAERYISRRELRALFPVSDMTIWRWQHDPQIAFPPHVKLGINGRNFWWLPAIRDWEQRRRNQPVEPSRSTP